MAIGYRAATGIHAGVPTHGDRRRHDQADDSSPPDAAAHRPWPSVAAQRHSAPSTARPGPALRSHGSARTTPAGRPALPCPALPCPAAAWPSAWLPRCCCIARTKRCLDAPGSPGRAATWCALHARGQRRTRPGAEAEGVCVRAPGVVADPWCPHTQPGAGSLRGSSGRPGGQIWVGRDAGRQPPAPTRVMRGPSRQHDSSVIRTSVLPWAGRRVAR
jgi:hypothetical protein